MARIRTIKPSFWSDSKVVALSPLARLMFIGMWNFAECDLGHLSDDAGAIKRQVLPDDDADADQLIEEIIASGMVARVQTLSGRRYLHIVHLSDHQKTDPRWSTRCPVCAQTRPNSSSLTETHPSLDEPHRVDGEAPPNSAQERKGKEVKTSSSTASRPTVDDTEFARFWAAYPRKVGKGEARKAWAKVIKSGITVDQVLAGVESYKRDLARRRVEPNFIKHPGPWLNAERWTDQLNGNDLEIEPARRAWWDN